MECFDEAVYESLSETAVETSPQMTGGAKAPSSLCSLGMRPFLMTGVLREILIWHFASPETIEWPKLKQFVWRPDASTPILIESIFRWIPLKTGIRPAIILKRNSYANHRVITGNAVQGMDRQGNRHYQTFWTGSHTLFCLADTGMQAELLGTEVQRELTEFGPVIRGSMHLTRFEVVEIGAVAMLEEAIQTFVVPLTVGYAYWENWILRLQAPKLKRLKLKTIIRQ